MNKARNEYLQTTEEQEVRTARASSSGVRVDEFQRQLALTATGYLLVVHSLLEEDYVSLANVTCEREEGDRPEHSKLGSP